MIIQRKNTREQYRSKHIRIQQSVKADSAIEHTDNFSVFCQAGGKIHYGNKNKNRGKHQPYPGDKIDVIIKNNSVERSFVVDKFVYLLGNINNNGYCTQQENGKEKRYQKFFNDIAI